jgi:hypothetical protein
MTTTQTLDQYSNASSTPSSDGPIVTGKQMLAQTFQAGVSGALEAVAVSVTCTKGAASLRPRVSIYSVVDGAPAQLLGEISVGTKNVAWSTRLPLSPAVPQVAGTTYAIVVSYPSASSTDRFRWSGTSSSDPAQPCLLGDSARWSGLGNVCDFQTFVSLSALGGSDGEVIVRGDGVLPKGS